MNKKRHTERECLEVVKLRNQGKTYAEIQQLFPFPKSTLSVWLNRYAVRSFDRTKQLEHLRRIRILAADSRRKIKLARDAAFAENALKVAKSLPTEESVLKSLLAMLYWAEGAKHKGVSGTKFVNTDPKLALLYITLLRKCYEIDEQRIRIRLHLHSYHDSEKALIFWSNLLGVSRKQFGKIYVKKRSTNRKFRENFMGICFITYLDSNVRKEILELGYAIQHTLAALPPSFNG